MGHPQVTLVAPPCGVPGLVLQVQLGLARDEGLVLDHQLDRVLGRGQDAIGDQRLLGVVGDDVGRCLTGIHVEPGDAPGVVVVEHQPRALGVGVEERLRTRTGVWHVRHILHADTLGVGRVLRGGGDPLVRGAVGDPRGDATVQVDDRPVLRITHVHRHVVGLVDTTTGRVLRVRRGRVHLMAIGRQTGPHHGGVRRQEQVALGAGGQQVAEEDPHRHVLVGDDRGAEIARLGHADRLVAVRQQDRAAVQAHQRLAGA